MKDGLMHARAGVHRSTCVVRRPSVGLHPRQPPCSLTQLCPLHRPPPDVLEPPSLKPHTSSPSLNVTLLTLLQDGCGGQGIGRGTQSQPLHPSPRTAPPCFRMAVAARALVEEIMEAKSAPCTQVKPRLEKPSTYRITAREGRGW